MKISKALKGKVPKNLEYLLSLPRGEEWCRKISIANSGKKNAMYGRKVSYEIRLKHSEAQKGEKGSNWQGGKTKESYIIRHGLEYKLWREAVYKRDNYTCVWCGERGGRLNADHIKPFATYPELRFAIDNGRTLCVPCHKTTDTYRGKGKRLRYEIL